MGVTMSAESLSAWIDQLDWPDKGLLPAIAQDARTGQVLMLAWMNRESLRLTVEKGRQSTCRALVACGIKGSSPVICRR